MQIQRRKPVIITSLMAIAPMAISTASADEIESDIQLTEMSENTTVVKTLCDCAFCLSQANKTQDTKAVELLAAEAVIDHANTGTLDIAPSEKTEVRAFEFTGEISKSELDNSVPFKEQATTDNLINLSETITWKETTEVSSSYIDPNHTKDSTVRASELADNKIAVYIVDGENDFYYSEATVKALGKKVAKTTSKKAAIEAGYVHSKAEPESVKKTEIKDAEPVEAVTKTEEPSSSSTSSGSSTTTSSSQPKASSSTQPKQSSSSQPSAAQNTTQSTVQTEQAPTQKTPQQPQQTSTNQQQNSTQPQETLPLSVKSLPETGDAHSLLSVLGFVSLTGSGIVSKRRKNKQ